MDPQPDWKSTLIMLNIIIIYFILSNSASSPLRTGNTSTDTFINSDNPDEMSHKATFHQGLHCLLRQNRPAEKEMLFFFNYDNNPSIYTVDHPNRYGNFVGHVFTDGVQSMVDSDQLI